MAETPVPTLEFKHGCPDCGERRVELPRALPQIGDDFDWLLRDYDGFRIFMLEELAARFPDRSRWTPADMEVVIVEALAAVLDQLSDMADRVASEACLETARRPDSLRRLLKLIGYNAARLAQGRNEIGPSTAGGDEEAQARELERYWANNPQAMEVARRAGPRAVHTQRRMVSADDYARRLEEHPLVLRAHAFSRWTGSWNTVQASVILWRNATLDAKRLVPAGADPTSPETLKIPAGLRENIDDFHLERGLGEVPWTAEVTIRTVLRRYLDAYRMAGQEVLLGDAVPVGLYLSISIQAAHNHFSSEVERAAAQALGTGPEGFFRPGRLRFGEDLHASDIFETLMCLDGVESVCLNRFKRVGKHNPDQSGTGRIRLEGIEIAVCDNDPKTPERGYFRLVVHGGKLG